MTAEEISTARQRRLEAMRLHEIEGNPLNAEEIAMFERKFHRMGNNRLHPHPDKTAGKILSWLNNFSAKL